MYPQESLHAPGEGEHRGSGAQAAGRRQGSEPTERPGNISDGAAEVSDDASNAFSRLMTASALINFREEMYLWSHRDGECRQVLRDPWYMRYESMGRFRVVRTCNSGSHVHKGRRSLCDTVHSSTTIAQRLAIGLLGDFNIRSVGMKNYALVMCHFRLCWVRRYHVQCSTVLPILT